LVDRSSTTFEDFILTEVVAGDSNPEVCRPTLPFQSRLTRKSKGQRLKLSIVAAYNYNQCPLISYLVAATHPDCFHITKLSSTKSFKKYFQPLKTTIDSLS